MLSKEETVGFLVTRPVKNRRPRTDADAALVTPPGSPVQEGDQIRCPALDLTILMVEAPRLADRPILGRARVRANVALALYDFYQAHVAQYDERIEVAGSTPADWCRTALDSHTCGATSDQTAEWFRL